LPLRPIELEAGAFSGWAQVAIAGYVAIEG